VIKVFICEDNDVERDSLCKGIENVILIEEYDMRVEIVTANPHDILDYMKKSEDTTSTGLYFIDVELGSDINGIELAAKIREYDPMGFIVIITSHVGTMPTVFTLKVEPLDFINKGDLFNFRNNVEICVKHAYKRYTEKSKERHNALTFKHDGRLNVVKFSDIISIETSATRNSHKLRLTTLNRIYEFRGNLKDIILKLNDSFIRLCQSYLVNKIHVDNFDISNREIIMTNGTGFSVPAMYMNATKKALQEI